MRKFSLVILSLSAVPAYAQEQSPGGDIVVTATGVTQPAEEVGQAVTVITRGDLTTRQTISLSDYLATTPGVTVSRNGTVGSFTGVRIRGAEAEQTLVLIDGVRVNDPSTPGGGFDFGNLLAGSIDRVELLRGPDSVPWGSQAIGGVINIVTQAPTDGLQARANAEYGYHDSLNANAGISGKAGPVAGSFTAGYLRTDGISSAASGTERDGYSQYGGTGRVTVEFAPGIGADLRGYYAHSRLQLDGYAPPTYTFGDDGEYSKIQEIYGYAGVYANLLNDRLKNCIAYTIADINRDNYDPTAGAAPIFFGRGRSERYLYQGDFAINDVIRIVGGAERENSRYSDGSTRANTGITSFYGEAIVRPIEQLTLTGGVRNDDHDAFGSHTTFGASGALALKTGTTLRASYGEGFKAPTLFQLYSNYGNRTLRPETARGYDLGVEQSALAGRAKVSATYFHRRTRNQIAFASCAAVDVKNAASICFNRPYGVYDNIDRTRARGVELAVALKPADALTITGEYSYTDSRNLSGGADYGNDLARRPKQTVSVSADYRLPFGLSVGGTLLHVSNSFDDAANTVPLKGYALASVRAELPVGKRFSIYGRVQNLFDDHYQTAAGYGTYGRAAYGGVRVRFD